MAGRKAMPVEQRFMEKVKKTDSGCWEWQAFCLPRGYGLFSIGGSNSLAHRVSFQLFVGALDAASDVMHSCDNPRCVNPNHLSLGSRTDNMQDARDKGRSAIGEKHGRSKLTAAQVLEIRNAAGQQRDIAKAYAVSQTTVSDIKVRRKWAHL
jgi:hypothetical protein